VADILTEIDESIARNAARFDPLGDAWDDDRVYRSGDEMRVVPARTGIEEEAVEPEAVVEEPGLSTEMEEALAHQPVMPPAPIADSRQSTADFARDVAAFRMAYGLYGNTYPQPCETCHALPRAVGFPYYDPKDSIEEEARGA
jgi:hypothetical protein